MRDSARASAVAMSLRREAGLGVIWTTINHVSNRFLGSVAFIVMAWILTPRDYGLIAATGTFVMFVQMLIGETFSEALLQVASPGREHTDSMFWFLQAVAAVGTAVLWFGAGSVASLYNEAEIADLVRATSPVVFLTSLGAVPSSLLRQRLDFRSLTLASVVAAIAGGVVQVAMAVGGCGVWSFIGGTLVSSLVGSALVWQKARYRPSFGYSVPHMRGMLAYGRANFLLRLSSFVSAQTPRMVVGHFFGADDLGQFYLAQRILELVLMALVIPVANVALPLVAKIKGDRAQVEKLTIGITQSALATVTPVVLGICATAPAAVPVLFGPQWTGSVVLVQITMVFGALQTLAWIYPSIMRGLGRPGLPLASALVNALTTLLLLYVVSPYGLVAATAAMALRSVVVWPLQLSLLRHVCGLGVLRQLRAYLPVMVAGSGMAVAVYGWMIAATSLDGRLALVIAVPLGAAVYLGLMILFARPFIDQVLAFLPKRFGGVGAPHAEDERLDAATP